MFRENDKEIDELKIIYLEIINGYTFSPELKCYIKHYSELDNIHITQIKKQFYQSFIDGGIPSEAERLQTCITNEEWTAKLEDDILSLKYIITDNEKRLSSVIIQQQDAIKKILAQKKQELLILLTKRRNAFGATAEEFCERDIINYMGYFSLYRDAQCKQRFFETWEEFDSLEENEIEKYVLTVDKTLKKFSEKSIKKIACLPFFINSFSYSKDNISTFLKKPIASLTNYQFMLCSLGSRNLNILAQAENDPPNMMEDKDIDNIINWYDSEYSILLGKKNNRK